MEHIKTVILAAAGVVVENTKTVIPTAFGIIGGLLSAALGGWDAAMIALIGAMAIDFITGWIVAGVFKNSKKSESGALESKASLKGLFRKGAMLLIVMLAVGLDAVMGTTFVRDAVIVGFIANEALSIVENAGLMGIPMAKRLIDAIEILKNKSEGDNNG